LRVALVDVARGRAYARYADVVWCETSTPDLKEAKQFAEGIRAEYPDKLLAYNCSPSFNWERNLDAHTIAKFQRELGAMGYAFQFITLAGWHLINLYTFELAKAYAAEGMPAYVRVQSQEFARERDGYTATKHQREAGTGYFDQVLTTITGGAASTAALTGSTEAEQFRPVVAQIVADAAPVDDDVVPLPRSAQREEIDPPPAA
jgi:isocitrate lyase